MTNAENNLKHAIEALNNNKLNAYEAAFINSIKEYSKKELKNISSKQYHLLVQCADKNIN